MANPQPRAQMRDEIGGAQEINNDNTNYAHMQMTLYVQNESIRRIDNLVLFCHSLQLSRLLHPNILIIGEEHPSSPSSVIKLVQLRLLILNHY